MGLCISCRAGKELMQSEVGAAAIFSSSTLPDSPCPTPLPATYQMGIRSTVTEA